MPPFLPVRSLIRSIRLILGLALTALSAFTGDARGFTPPPPDPPELKALAASLVAAPDDVARDRLLAAASPAWRDHPQLGHALNRAWGPIIYTGDYARAGKLGEYARRLLLGRGDAVQAANALYLLGSIDGYRGDNQAALGKFSEARHVFEVAHDEEKLAMVLASAGLIHLQLGDFQLALAETRRALEVHRANDHKPGIINESNTMGNIFMAQGMTDRAMDCLQQALAAAEDDPSWQAYLFHNIANVYARRGERNEAIDWMSRSVALAAKIGEQPTYAVGLQELGSLHLQNGQLDLAEDELRHALGIGVESGDKRRQAGALTGLGDLLRRRTDEKSRREALECAERAMALARETGEPAYIWRSCTLAGNLFLASHEPEQARKAFEESIAAIEDARGHVAAGDTGATAFLEDKMAPYHGMVALLIQENHPAEALAMAEQATARVLVDLLTGPKLDFAQAMTDPERASFRQHAEEIAALNRQIAAARAALPPVLPKIQAELDAKLAVARRARDDAEEDFFIAHPELRNRRPPHVDGGLSNAALDGLVADGKTALLEYVVTDDETFVFTVTKARNAAPDAPPMIRAQRLPLGRAALHARTERFRAALAEGSMGWQADARALGRDLLGPIHDECADSSRLIIVADGPLWELPFQALADGGADAPATPLRTLWESHALSFAPSLTFLAQEPAAPLTHPARLLAIGNPALAAPPATGELPSPGSLLGDAETSPMPEAERQVHTLAALYGAAHCKVLAGTEAHEDTFKRLAGDYDVIHFATHGYLNDTAPMYSRLLMAQTDLAPDEDGQLEAWEWLPLRLHARLTVLSACESARGRIGEGEGVVGLSWAVFRAGCPAVVVSQWKVDSASSTALMTDFHRRLLTGEPPEEALREAALKLKGATKYRHPFYWAPFVLVGAGTAIMPPSQQRW